jgi:class 3 adenylate cyclase/tetratricopeptide (TPR) repeat protein
LGRLTEKIRMAGPGHFLMRLLEHSTHKTANGLRFFHGGLCACGQENPEGFKFCGACAAPLDAGPAATREERKIVTVLFADLVGFTSRAEQLDPEDVRGVLAPYHERLREELERFGGTVEKFIGDAVMALFGAPVAHEDDPERAVRAGLAIRDWAAAESIELRIGINTGEALVTVGAELLAAGDVVNTAARLQSAAATGGILVGEATYRATRHVIDYRDADPVQAKGKAEPIRVWAAADARSRFGTGVVDAPSTPLVGRERELTLLSETLVRVREERSPQLVTLVGVPGIGKSRLVYELFGEIGRGSELTYWRQGRSLPYGDGVTFWALAEMVKAQAGILETDPADEVERKLVAAVENLVGDHADADWVVKHLRPLAGLVADADVSGDAQNEAFAAWRRFFEALAEHRPAVLVFEDLHWADDGLLDFVDHLVDWTGDVPILVVCTARPELLERRPGWGGGKLNAATLSLSPLSDADTGRLLSELLEQPVVDADVQQRLLAHAGGNPLYAEQFAQMLEETKDTGDLPIPESVQGIIAARLDLLAPDEKQLLQDAAVLGKVFWLGALGASLEQLHPLERKGFVQRARRSSVADEIEYTFRHLLVRDVAYAQIPRAARADKHRRAAEWIASLGRPEDHAEMLAHHYTDALEFARAAGQPLDDLVTSARIALREAGDRALALGAFAAAARFYTDALELWPRDDPERPRLLLALGRAHARVQSGEQVLREALEGLSALGDDEGAAEAELLLSNARWLEGRRDEADAHMERALALVADVAPSAIKARVLSELSRYHMLARRDEAAVAVARQALEMAEHLGLDAIRAHALNNLGTARANSGDRSAGAADIRRSIEIATAANSPELLRGYVNLAVVYGGSGDVDRVRATQDEGLRVGERFASTDMFHWLYVQRNLFQRYAEGRIDDALAFAEELIAGEPHYTRRSAYGLRCDVRLARGDAAGALDDARRCLELAREAKDPQALLPGLTVCAFASASAGRLFEAEDYAREALAFDHGLFHQGPTLYYLAWVFTALGKTGELTEELSRVPRESPWLDAGKAIAAGQFARAAHIYGGARTVPWEACTHLRAAQAGDPDADLDRAIELFRMTKATAYLAEAELLLKAMA